VVVDGTEATEESAPPVPMRWSSSRSTHATTPTSTSRAGSLADERPHPLHQRRSRQRQDLPADRAVARGAAGGARSPRRRAGDDLHQACGHRTARAGARLSDQPRRVHARRCRSGRRASARSTACAAACCSALRSKRDCRPNSACSTKHGRASCCARPSTPSSRDTALSELLQVARRLSLDADPRGGKPPWQDALGKLVDQARANAIDADAAGIRHGQRRQPARALSGACQDGSRCTPGRRAWQRRFPA
jgi:hypothetical protein